MAIKRTGTRTTRPDGTTLSGGAFARQQAHEAAGLTLPAPVPGTGDHERFLDGAGRLEKLVHFNAAGKPTDTDNGTAAVILFRAGGDRIEKHYRDGVLHDGSGVHPSVRRFHADGRISTTRGHQRPGGLRPHDPADGQPAEEFTWKDGPRVVRHSRFGQRHDGQDGSPAEASTAPDGTTTSWHMHQGRENNPSPGAPACTITHPDGTRKAVAWFEHGKRTTDGYGNHALGWHPDGSLAERTSLQEVEGPYGPVLRPVTTRYAPARDVFDEASAANPLTEPELAALIRRGPRPGVLRALVRASRAIPKGGLPDAAEVDRALGGQGLVVPVTGIKFPGAGNRTRHTMEVDASALLSAWRQDPWTRFWFDQATGA